MTSRGARRRVQDVHGAHLFGIPFELSRRSDRLQSRCAARRAA